MDERDAGQVEENTALLIRAALGPDARLPTALRRSMLRRLLQAGAHPVDFPDAVVVLLSGAMLAAAGVLGWLLAQGGGPLASNPALLLPAAGLALNLALLPATGAAIVLGRKRE